MSILSKVNYPSDIKNLSIDQLNILCKEIREELVKSVSDSGGHLASNLGVVELTVALHYVYDTPSDKIIWDVGHQSYVHKILTGRKDKMSTLRKFGGISGFPKVSESEYDTFNVGHSSTSISAAIGYARARDIQGGSENVIAVIGDGSMTGGMAFEALNDIGQDKDDNILIILNDNQMSISENVGALSRYLNRLRTVKIYNVVKETIDNVTDKYAVLRPLHNVLKWTKNQIKHIFLPTTIFEALGYIHIGPVDGHNMKMLIETLRRIKRIKGKVLFHVTTVKGKGYEHAENDPNTYHSVGKFDIESGKSQKEKTADFSSVMGNALIQLAKNNDKIVAITAAMPTGTGLMDFYYEYPDRVFDVGIAEQHAVTMACGMARNKIVPVVAIYSSFLQRAYDQVLHDICLQNLHVVLCIDRAGLVGEDGETHHGLYDVSFLSAMPNMCILTPSTFTELEIMLDYAVNKHNGPIAIRYPRGGSYFESCEELEYGKGLVMREGKDIVIFSYGKMVNTAMEISQKMSDSHGMGATVVNLRWAKPIDFDLICQTIKDKKNAFVIEDVVRQGGVGEQIRAYFNKNKINIPLECYSIEDGVQPHGAVDILIKNIGLDTQSLEQDMVRKIYFER